MPLVDRVGRRSWRTGIGFVLAYSFLILGGASMIYPFAIMLTSSVSSTVDYRDFGIYPKYLFDDESLFRKVIHDRYNFGHWGSARQIRRQYHLDLLEPGELRRPVCGDVQRDALLRDWERFREQIPDGHWTPGHIKTGYEDGRVQRLYREWLEARYADDISRYNRVHQTAHESFARLRAPLETPTERDWVPQTTPSWEEWREFRATLRRSWFYPASLEGIWQQYLQGRYQKSIRSLNQAWQTEHTDFWRIPLPSRRPDQPMRAADWDVFVREQTPPRYVQLMPSLRRPYQNLLRSRYRTIADLNASHGTAFASFDDVFLPEGLADEERQPIVQDVLALLVQPGVAEQIRLVDPDNRWRVFLQETYGSVEKLSVAHQMSYASFAEAVVPQAMLDWSMVQEEADDWRHYFLTANYSEVFSFLLKHGRALLNTVVYCIAMICVTLTINPLCAYALSRFNLRYANKVLLFLLATMAFPAEVAMIPNFLLLRDLGLLNTYLALILPGVASGYSIFLLKGFFDSLPSELYEAAVVDGASEMTIFWKITLPLAKPVLAYLGLGAFTGAYQAFLFAMVTCPDPKRWTIMVFLYDMRNWATSSTTMAALVVASIPTLLIFIFSQKIIMRGIVVPIEK